MIRSPIDVRDWKCALIVAGILMTAGCQTRAQQPVDSVPPETSVPRVVQDQVSTLLAPWDDPTFFELAGTTDFADEQSLRQFATRYTGWLRGRCYHCWADRLILSPQGYYDFSSTVATVYHWAIAVADNTPVPVAEAVYRPLLIDHDPEVRHLAAHTLIIAYVRNGRRDSRSAADIRAFCAADDSSTVRALAREDHPVWQIMRTHE